ncbi:MAG: S-layer homology domain-containing protein [Gorillibacterium sp.]|nr:S-layer homology domain-containing protein [Gorillibacterium sp.]
MKALNKKLAMIILSLLMSLSLLSNAFAESNASTDYESHWAKESIQKALDSGILKGYPDGTIRPNNQITRAEFFALVNNAFGFEKTAAITFSDIKNNSWAYPVVAKAQAAGYITGYPDGTIHPESQISREEAAVVVSHILSLKPSTEVLPFTDISRIAVWSKLAVLSIYEAKIMSGYPDGSFKPASQITRAEAVVTLLKALEARSAIYDRAGTFGPETEIETIHSTVMIKASNVKLQNLHITGDLIIGEEVGEGNAILNNVTVEGDTFIRGGGPNSIHIQGGSYNKITVQQLSSKQIRIVAVDVSGLEIVISKKSTGKGIILEGTFERVTIEADDVDIQTQNHTVVKEMIVAAQIKDVNIDLSENTSVSRLVLNSAIQVTGQGTITLAEVNADNVAFEKAPLQQTVGPAVTITPVVTGGGNGGSTGSNGGSTGGNGGSGSSVVGFFTQASFTGSFTSELRVKIDGQVISNFSLYYNNTLVAATTNGVVTTVNNVFSDLSKVKIQYNGSYWTDSDLSVAPTGGVDGSATSEVEILIHASFENAITSDMKVKIDGEIVTNYSLYYNNDLVTTTIDGVITTASSVFNDLSKLKIQYNGSFWTDSDSAAGTW